MTAQQEVLERIDNARMELVKARIRVELECYRHAESYLLTGIKPAQEAMRQAKQIADAEGPKC